MSYASTDEFTSKIGSEETLELTNLDTPGATSINLTKLQDALDDATGEINGYLATRYLTPLTSIPRIIVAYCVDIAWYRLAHNNAPEQFQTRYNNAIARLRDIEQGRMLLTDDKGIALPKRDPNQHLIDERGNTLDDWTSYAEPGGRPVHRNWSTFERLNYY